MNIYIILFCFLLFSYLFGGILFAIPITKIALGKDIRTIGNKNPGTSNTFKNVNPLAGTLTAILDMSKGIFPIIIAKQYFFQESIFRNWLFLCLIGMTVVLGHARPWWNRFRKGGGGMGTAVGIFSFFVPVEFALAIIIGTIITYTFMNDAEYKFGRWVMMFAAALIPFIIIITNYLFDIHIWAHVSIGGHNQGLVIGMFLLLIELLLLNLDELTRWLKQPPSKNDHKRVGDV